MTAISNCYQVEEVDVECKHNSRTIKFIIIYYEVEEVDIELKHDTLSMIILYHL